jgi:hypothetical protein
MRERNLYVCELCNREYEMKEHAEACELVCKFQSQTGCVLAEFDELSSVPALLRIDTLAAARILRKINFKG